MRYSLLFLTLVLFFSCNKNNNLAQDISLTWTMGENNIDWGVYENTFQLANNSKDTLLHNWVIYFNQQPAAVVPDSSASIKIEQISSTYYRMSPTNLFKGLAPSETLDITFRCRSSILKMASAPEGAYCVWLDEEGNDKEIKDVTITVVPFSKDYQWARKGTAEIPYPYGELVYEDNKLFANPVKLKQTDILPSIKELEVKTGTTVFAKEVHVIFAPEFENEGEMLKTKLAQLYDCTFSETATTTISLLNEKVADKKNDEHYNLTVEGGKIEIKAESAHAIFNGTQTVLVMLGANDLPLEMENITVSDYPDIGHRGFMLDVSRNFTKKENVLKLIDILSSYKMTVLHLHLSDDEGWRLEIPGIEELTTVGATRGHSYDEKEMLYPAYGGGWNPASEGNLGTGYYTRQDFIEILKYADAHHIKIIPEFDFPAHSRAAIKATTARYHKYIATDKAKAEEYLLEDFNDTSVYNSAQSYTDNALNVALPSAYTFVEKVINEVDLVYKDAGLKLEVLHLGGDEVPHGAWEGSDICKAFMKENNFTEIRELKDYFIDKVLAILDKKGIQLASWQEVGLLPDGTLNERFAKRNVLSYCWSTIPERKEDDVPYKLANTGFPIILCNASNFYMDFTYNKHEEEPGAYWGGFVNEYKPFDVLPYNIYYSVRNDLKGDPINFQKANSHKLKLNPNAKGQIKGVQVQLWAETIRSFEMIEYYIFPKIFGMLERGWNVSPNWEQNPEGIEYTEALQKFSAKLYSNILPALDKKGANFRIPMPGVVIENGKLNINSPIQGAKIYYSTDGSMPTEQSKLWTEPVACDAKTVRAKAYYLGKASVATLYNK